MHDWRRCAILLRRAARARLTCTMPDVLSVAPASIRPPGPRLGTSGRGVLSDARTDRAAALTSTHSCALAFNSSSVMAVRRVADRSLRASKYKCRIDRRAIVSVPVPSHIARAIFFTRQSSEADDDFDSCFFWCQTLRSACNSIERSSRCGDQDVLLQLGGDRVCLCLDPNNWASSLGACPARRRCSQTIGVSMQTRRFGRKLKLPSTRAIKHQIRKLMLDDLIKADTRERIEAIPLQLKHDRLQSF